MAKNGQALNYLIDYLRYVITLHIRSHALNDTPTSHSKLALTASLPTEKLTFFNRTLSWQLIHYLPTQQSQPNV